MMEDADNLKPLLTCANVFQKHKVGRYQKILSKGYKYFI